MTSTHWTDMQQRSYGSIRLHDFAGAPFRGSQFTVLPGRSTSVDRHEVSELWIVLQGEGAVLENGVVNLPLSVGSAVRFESNEPHQVSNVGQEPLVLLSLWWPS